MKKIIRYFKFWTYLSICHFKRDATYAVSFWSSMVSAFVHAFLRIFVVIFLTDKISSLAGWSRDEMILFVGTYQIIIAASFLLVHRGLMWLFRSIDNGDLDTVLFKPIDSQFMATMRAGNIGNLIATFFGFGLVGYQLIKMSAFSFLGMLTFMMFILTSLSFVYSIFLIVSMSAFFANKVGNILDLAYRSLDFSQFPSDAYQKIGTLGFIAVLPISYLTTIPCKILLGKITTGEVGIFLSMSIFSLIISRLLWKFALKHYQSVSS